MKSRPPDRSGFLPAPNTVQVTVLPSSTFPTLTMQNNFEALPFKNVRAMLPEHHATERAISDTRVSIQRYRFLSQQQCLVAKILGPLGDGFFCERVVAALSFRQWLHALPQSRYSQVHCQSSSICTRCGCSPPGTHWACFHMTSAGRIPLCLVGTLVSFLHVRISSLPTLAP